MEFQYKLEIQQNPKNLGFYYIFIYVLKSPIFGIFKYQYIFFFQIGKKKFSFINQLYEKLKSFSEEELESVCLVFTYSSGNTEAELITKGSQTNVSKKNLELYLNKTAEYVIHKQFDKIYKSFIEGFSSVLDIQICQKWLLPQEMSLLTQGLLEIKSEILLSKFHFTGGKPQHKSYFETYVSQAPSETLKNMLKFITGSSSIPFDQSSYVITVRFESSLSDRKLPLSHTCFKSIEVPLYKSYAELKQKLDIAFTIGFEGYGFG